METYTIQINGPTVTVVVTTASETEANDAAGDLAALLDARKPGVPTTVWPPHGYNPVAVDR